MNNEPCDMEYMLCVEDVLDSAKKEEMDCVVVAGFKGQDPVIMCSGLKDRYRVVGLLEEAKCAVFDDDPESWGGGE